MRTMAVFHRGLRGVSDILGQPIPDFGMTPRYLQPIVL